jgi:hypothetical protein
MKALTCFATTLLPWLAAKALSFEAICQVAAKAQCHVRWTYL